MKYESLKEIEQKIIDLKDIAREQLESDEYDDLYLTANSLNMLQIEWNQMREELPG